MKLLCAFLSLAVWIAVTSWASAQEVLGEVAPTLINDLSPSFESAQEKRRARDRAEDMAVLSAILREDLMRLYARDPHASVGAAPAAVPPHASNLVRTYDRATWIELVGAQSAPGTVGNPLAEYLPGYGVIVQVEAPPPYRPSPAEDAAASKRETLSRWEATQRRLRGEPQAENVYDHTSCAACHVIDSRAVLLHAWETWMYGGAGGFAPSKEQIVAALTEVLAQNGRHLRHMQPDDKITLAVQFAPAALSPRSSPEQSNPNKSQPAAPKASGSSQAQPHNRELAGDLLLKQGKYAEAERAYMEAYYERRKTHPDQPHTELLGKAFSAAVTRKAAESNAAGVSDEVFLRRVYLDLTGQPPTAKEIEQFTTERFPDKRAKLIEKLLQSSDYAESWISRWTDVLVETEDPNQAAEPSNAARQPQAEEIASAIDDYVLTQLHQIAPATSSPLPGRISVTATKRQMDNLAAGALRRDEFDKQVLVQLFDPAERSDAPAPRSRAR